MSYFFQNFHALHGRKAFGKSYFGHEACWNKRIAIAYYGLAVDFNALCTYLQGFAGFARIHTCTPRKRSIGGLQRIGQASVQTISDTVAFVGDLDLIAIIKGELIH